MKKTVIMILIFGMIFGSVPQAFASDWDKAGKALAVIEGIRLVTGDRVDVFGKIGQVVRGEGYSSQKSGPAGKVRYKKPYHKQYVNYHRCTTQKIWVPQYTWERHYIPEHTEHRAGYGKVIVEGHYIRVKKEYSGHWEYRDYCG